MIKWKCGQLRPLVQKFSADVHPDALRVTGVDPALLVV
jgi:hypothetical protein